MNHPRRYRFGEIPSFNNGIMVYNGILGDFSGNTINYKQNFPISFDAGSIGDIFTNNTINDFVPGSSVIEVRAGYITEDTQWSGDFVYEIQGSIFVQGTDGADGVTTLTLDPGSNLQFEPNAYLQIGASSANPGALVAQGNKTKHILFTSNAETPTAGSWSGIRFYPTPEGAFSILDYCDIKYAGQTGQYAVYIYNSSPTITNTSISESLGHGISVNSGSPTINYSSIYNIANYGIYNPTQNIINAKNNWWGHASGPTHSSNPEGTGSQISDNVDYIPWLGSIPDNNKVITDVLFLLLLNE